MAPFRATPAFYDLPLESGETDMYEFFKNHSEIGPFVQLPRTGTIAADIQNFFSRWSPSNNDYAVEFKQSTSAPSFSYTPSAEESRELIALYANASFAKLAGQQPAQATRLAIAYKLVTPLTPAIVVAGSMPATSPSSSNDSASSQASTMVVQGINTAGTVRVNNLANLEALLNILANLFEVGGIALGCCVFLQGLTSRGAVTRFLGTDLELSAGARMGIGAGLILAAFTVPGMINWFVASARDANLFS